MADWVATVALSVISNNLGEAADDSNSSKNGSLDPSIELTTFWAPFLLLHLGGPDTITAYALEDNELWLRHLLGLGVQTGVAFYALLLAWTGSWFSILSIFMFCAGVIKYGERTWVLRSASSEQFRDSMLTPPDPGPNYSKFMQEYTLKEIEGFHVVADEVIEVQLPVYLASAETISNIPDAQELITAYNLLQIFKRLLVDLILGVDDRNTCQSLFKDISSSKAFKVVEIELGFVYDMLYTKATLIYSLKGCVFRFISFSFTTIVLAMFSVYVAHNDHKHSKTDLTITFLLMSIAVVLEIYAILLMLSSDWTDLWLSKRRSSYMHQLITSLQLIPKHPIRWSNSMAQYNLLSYCLGEKPAFCYKIQKLFGIDEMLEKQRYKTIEKEVSTDLKDMIFNNFQMKLKLYIETSTDLKALCSFQGIHVLEEYNCTSLCWSLEVDFDQSILIWHIATDLCYYNDLDAVTDSVRSNCAISKQISCYMLYLLVLYPFMLPTGIGMIRFRDTCADAMYFFDERIALTGSRKNSKLSKAKACDLLLKVNTVVPPSKVKGDRSKSVLFEACRLARMLQGISDKGEKWKMIGNVWVEMLAYAASHCRGNYHAQQLRRGGELLTHVWLLMAHFGLTEQFQISQGHARAKLSVK
ncbi:DUF594 family protein [Quillaja saponaria]|uniref:DUF594 family protein n=1 Tax=Quillaja saponaria TaxID=32244 RepID=A0AAD7M5Q5_QUISA|nr:DUF594 family protein [Quillaja saponaria]